MKRFCPSALFLLLLCVAPALAQQQFAPPPSPRITFNFNPNWRFIRQDVAGAQAPTFDDAAWTTISTPHTYNDTDTFNKLISHTAGQAGAYMGPAWYRKHFKLPEELKGRTLILEFEGLRQAARFYLNGRELGLYENGITAYGLDITSSVTFGDSENLLAIRVDNSNAYAEEATHTVFQWESKDFNPNYGGITHRVWLHALGKIHQTLPIYEGLQTTGTYIYPSDISIPDKSATIHIESQIANDSADPASVTLSAVLVDRAGIVCARLQGDTQKLAPGEKSTLKAAGSLTNAQFWSPQSPALYDVYTILAAPPPDGKILDLQKITTGFRKTAFKGGAGSGGIFINDRFTYLTGYAQRSTDEWAGLGQAYPDWMHDYSAQLVRDSHANYMRWMHISPQKVDVEAYERAGIVQVCPAGDKEKDATGTQWQQRLAVMRDSIIYFRNHPSILFWEAGNTVISPDHMRQMVELRKTWDPNGGRVMGTRGDSDNPANAAITPVAEYYGVMIGQDDSKDTRKNPADLFRAFSLERRDRAPLIETEDFRDEGARRFWDDYSAPHYGFKKGPLDVYNWNSETFALAAVVRYDAYLLNRIDNPDPQHSKWAGYASIYFSDSNADGRQASSEVCRVSGKVDAVRLPKEIYYTYQVMQNPDPQVHILGHWSYPTAPVSDVWKTIFVISNTQQVELFLNGQSLGKAGHSITLAFDANAKPIVGQGDPTRFVFAFPNILFRPGTLRAVGYNGDKPVADYQLETAGPPAALKLTPHTSPAGLHADGQDVAFFDVEVVDAAGNRCPTDEARIDFEVAGPCVWRGGYNSGILDSTNNQFLLTECGINRVSLRATLTPGPITLTASRSGLTTATITVNSLPFPNQDGLAPPP